MVLGCSLLKTGRRGEQRAAPAGTLDPAADGTGSALACRPMKLMAIVVAVAALILAGCGGSGGGDHETTAAVSTHRSTTTAEDSTVSGKLPAGSVGPVD